MWTELRSRLVLQRFWLPAIYNKDESESLLILQRNALTFLTPFYEVTLGKMWLTARTGRSRYAKCTMPYVVAQNTVTKYISLKKNTNERIQKCPLSVQAQCQTYVYHILQHLKYLHTVHTVYLLGLVRFSQTNSYYLPTRMSWLFILQRKSFAFPVRQYWILKYCICSLTFVFQRYLC